MAIVHLGAKRVQGTKVDRVVDSLGSSADGVNTGITLITTTGTITLGSGADGSSIGTCGDNAQGVPYVGLVCKSGSLVAGCKITNVKMDLYRHHHSGSTSAPTTALQARIIRGSDDGVQETVTSSTTFANLPTSSPSSPNVTFTFSGNYEIQVGDRIVLYYNWSNAEWYAKMDRQSGSGFVDQYVYQQSGSWDSGSATLQPHMEITHTTNSNVKLGTGCYQLPATGADAVSFAGVKDNKLLPATGDFSITCWIYHTGHSDHQQIFRCQDSNGSSEGEFRINSSGNSNQEDRLALSLPIGSNGTVMSTNAVVQNEWVHLAVTRTGATVKFYINGTLETTQATSGTFNATSAWGDDTPRIGRMENANETIQGKIDDLGVWHRVLTATEISDLVNKTGATDGIGSEGDLTNSGTITYNAGLVGKCIHCDFAGTEGTGSGAPTGTFFRQANSNNNDFNFIHTAGQTWTVNFWIKGDSANLDRVSQLIGNTSSGVSGGVKGFYINILDRRTQYSEQNRVHTSVQNGGAVYVNWNGTDGDLPDDTNWHMITMRCNGTQVNGAKGVITHVDGGTSNNFTDEIMYMNRNTSVTGSATNASNGLMFGRNLANPYSDYYHWDGSFDEVSIWNRELTDAECVALYNDGDGEVTTTAVTNHSELKAYWNFNDQMKNQASPVLTGALVSSLSDKSNLKAHYTMDSLSLGATGTTTTTTSGADNTNGAQSGSNQTTVHVTSGSNTGLKFTSTHNGSGAAIGTFDLGSALASKWIAQVSFTTGSGYTSSGNGMFAFGLSDKGTYSSSEHMNTNSSGDTVNWIWHLGSSNDRKQRIRTILNGSGSDGTQGTSRAWEDSTTFYFEMSYDGSTVTAQRKTDDTYATNHSQSAVTKSTSGITGLQYFNWGSTDNGGSQGGFNVTLNTLKIYDGVSSLDGCKNDFSATSALDGQTNLPVNTIFEQIDDSPTYWWKQSDNTWSLDGTTQQEPSLTDSATWSMVGKQTGSATTTLTGGKLRYVQATNHGTADSGAVAVYDTGGTTDTFVIRFNFTTGSSHSDGGGNANLFWGLSSNGSYSSSQGFNTDQGQDAVAFRWHFYSNKTRLGYWNGGSLTWGTDPNESLTLADSTTYYWELSFDGSTTTLKRFTDSTYGTAAHTGTQTSVSGVYGLRYFVLGGTIDSQMGVFTIDHNKFEIQKGRSTWLE